MSNLKRYQNPELFQQLAIEYAIGSLHGRARKRFEILMETHFYLNAVVTAYENKFAHLVELLPDEQPSNIVWENIAIHIKSSHKRHLQKEIPLWWKKSFFKQGLILTVLILIVSTALLFNQIPSTRSPTANAYSAILESDLNNLKAITNIRKSDMKLSIEFIQPVLIEDGMELILWCRPKRGGMPMKMGTVFNLGRTEIKISQNEWQSMKDVGMLSVSVEHKVTNTIREPAGQIILSGQLISSN